jgi:hypothetical protein
MLQNADGAAPEVVLMDGYYAPPSAPLTPAAALFPARLLAYNSRMQEIAVAVSREELAELSEPGAPCITCCLPLPAPGENREELPGRYDRLLETAAARLEALAPPSGSGDVAALLQPLRSAKGNEEFWLSAGQSAVLFSAPGLSRTYCLPYATEELVHTGPQGYIRPLLPLLSPGRFLVLAASRRRARLIRVDGAVAEQHDLPGYPGPLEDFARARGEDQPGWSEAPGATGMGYSVGEPDPAEAKYFAALSGAVDQALAGDTLPLVLAVDSELGGALRKHLKYRNLVQAFVHGNPDIHSAEELRAKAWPLAAAIVTQARQAAWDELARCQTDGQCLADDLSEVLAAASGGRVAALFLPATGQVWGTYDAPTGSLAETAADAPGVVDLLNLAAVQTLRAGGEVYVADQPLPGAMQFAATLRY